MKVNPEIKYFIKNSELSYRKILTDIDNKFRVKLSKSTISYYKRSKNRLVNLHLDETDQKDIDWLNGFFTADGCKFIERKYSYVIKFALDSKSDKDILEKLVRILNQLGCKFLVISQGNMIIVRLFSKVLFEVLPTKNKQFIPKDAHSFLAGLIDGDGCKKGNSAILVQYKNIAIMKYLSKHFGFKGNMSRVKTPYGNSLRRQYYIPKDVCDSIRHLSVKLNR